MLPASTHLTGGFKLGFSFKLDLRLKPGSREIYNYLNIPDIILLQHRQLDLSCDTC